MSTITAILEAQPDGSLHLPLPAEFQHRRVRVEATLEEIDASEASGGKATLEMLSQRERSLDRLRELGGLADLIPDPVAWQRAQREDRSAPICD